MERGEERGEGREEAEKREEERRAVFDYKRMYREDIAANSAR